MKLRLLPEHIINKIAAGEVLERPASAIKELVENSIDAGATKLHIQINSGGRNLIAITDNGAGMDKQELELAILRHATSKLNDDDLFDINFFGFRGEALASIAAVSRVTITSRKQNAKDAWTIELTGGNIDNIKPANWQTGTKIEVRDLFFATPARLNFLKSERSEIIAIKDTIHKIAMAHPHIEFTLEDEKQKLLALKVDNANIHELGANRISDILGKKFYENSLPLDFKNDDIKISGYVSLPTFNLSTSTSQYLFVNGRAIRDKILQGSIRAAYQDYLAHNRFPAVVAFIDIKNDAVDVNVHPTKAEIRFRDSDKVKSLFIRAIKSALADGQFRASTTIAEDTLSKFKNAVATNNNPNIESGEANSSLPISNLAQFKRPDFSQISTKFPQNIPQVMDGLLVSNAQQLPLNVAQSSSKFDYNARQGDQKQNYNWQPQQRLPFAEQITQPKDGQGDKEDNINEEDNIIVAKADYPLGLAKAQIFDTYIVAQSDDSLIIVDQHAAHERLVYEKMKKSTEGKKIVTQLLLIPEIIELGESETESLCNYKDELAKLGLVFDKISGNTVAVRETPMMLGEFNIIELVKDLVHDIVEHDQVLSLNEKFEHLCGTMACHGSIRAGRKMNIVEMNAILRQMEQTPYSGQCNHGRPTYVELKINDIEKLFGRK